MNLTINNGGGHLWLDEDQQDDLGQQFADLVANQRGRRGVVEKVTPLVAPDLFDFDGGDERPSLDTNQHQPYELVVKGGVSPLPPPPDMDFSKGAL